ncbi:MAG: hypothetical protein R3F05_00940 [Planctomycetota bacterium]
MDARQHRHDRCDLGGLAILWVPGLLLRVRRLESRVAVLHELRLLDLEGE